MPIRSSKTTSAGGTTGTLFSRNKYLVISIYSDNRTPNPSKPGKPIAVPMLWGVGTSGDPADASRLAQFKQITTSPKYVLGYEEPDCPSGSGSAGLSVSAGVVDWQSLIAPLGKKGTLLGSPSMCSMSFPIQSISPEKQFITKWFLEQAAETWLGQFRSQISTQWDFTAVHINKNSLDGVKKDIVRALDNLRGRELTTSPRIIIGTLTRSPSG